MRQHKLVLDTDFSDEFSLVAIHCSEEPYKMAFLLNQNVALRLRRTPVDLDCSTGGLQISFPFYSYKNAIKYTDYHLLANKCKSPVAGTRAGGQLFLGDEPEKHVVSYFLPEFKKVDYFLKIYSEFETVPLRKIISGINEIKQVISAYAVAPETIKSKNNLIFD